MKQRMSKILIVVFAVIFVMAMPALAQNTGIDDKESFDVYFSSGNNESSIVRNVRIIGFQDIGKKSFIIIRPYGFKLSDSIGYISLESITAILPNQDARVETNKNVNIRY